MLWVILVVKLFGSGGPVVLRELKLKVTVEFSPLVSLEIALYFSSFRYGSERPLSIGGSSWEK